MHRPRVEPSRRLRNTPSVTPERRTQGREGARVPVHRRCAPEQGVSQRFHDVLRCFAELCSTCKLVSLDTLGACAAHCHTDAQNSGSDNESTQYTVLTAVPVAKQSAWPWSMAGAASAHRASRPRAPGTGTGTGTGGGTGTTGTGPVLYGGIVPPDPCTVLYQYAHTRALEDGAGARAFEDVASSHCSLHFRLGLHGVGAERVLHRHLHRFSK